jgi:hypothetical protein
MAFISNKQLPKVGSKASFLREKITYSGTWERGTEVRIIKECLDPRGDFWEVMDEFGNTTYLSQSEFKVIC